MSSASLSAPPSARPRRRGPALAALTGLVLAGMAGAGALATPARAADGLPVTGTAQVGQTLLVPVQCAGNAQWLRDGQPIERATTGAYTLTAHDLGHRISVQEFCTSGGTQTSVETAVVINSEPELPVIANLTQPPPGVGPLEQAAQASVVGDPTDPGVDLYVGQLAADQSTLVDPGALHVTAAVQQKGQRVSPFGATPAPNAVSVSTEGGAVRHVSFAPVQRGNTTVMLTVTGTSGKTATYTLDYYASMATTPTSTVLQTASDASTAIAAGDGYLFVGNDEDHRIRLFNANASGLPVATFNPGQNPNAAGEGEDDYESSARVGDSVFWLGSQGNSKKGEIEVNRHVLFETSISGSGASAALTPVGAYGGLRRDLVAWDQAHGNRYGFAAATASGQAPDGPAQFNIEGAEFAPDDTTLYLGFRAPLVGRVPGGDALIVPLTNIFDLTSGAATAATFGEPIELDLDGQSIREIRRNDAGEYLILSADAPAAATTSSTPDVPQLLWYWDGDPDAAPQRLSTVVEPDLEECYESRAAWEGIGELPASLDPGTQVRLIMDQGYDCAYSPYHATGDSILYDPTSLKDFISLSILSNARTDLVTLTGGLGFHVDLAGSGDFDGTFDRRQAGTVSAPERVTVTNTGTKELTIGAVSLSTGDAADFRLDSDTCAETALSPGAACTVEVRFAPAREGAVSHTELVVASNIDGGASSFALSGTSLATFASAAAPTIAGSSHEVGDILTATVPAWTPTAELALQWLRDGLTIPGATSDSIPTTTADSGHALRLQVTGTADGYVTRTVTSDPVTVSPRTASVTLSVTGTGQQRVLTAIISPRLAGTVTFRDGTSMVGNAPVDLSTRTASLRASLAAGTHVITAEFTPADTLEGRAATSTPVAVTIEKTNATVPAVVSVKAAKGLRLKLRVALADTSAKPTVAKVKVKIAGAAKTYTVLVTEGEATVTLGRTARELAGRKVKITVTVPPTMVITPTTVYTVTKTTKTAKIKLRD